MLQNCTCRDNEREALPDLPGSVAVVTVAFGADPKVVVVDLVVEVGKPDFARAAGEAIVAAVARRLPGVGALLLGNRACRTPNAQGLPAINMWEPTRGDIVATMR